MRAWVCPPMFFAIQAFWVEEEPILVGRAVAVFKHMMELPEAARGMVKNTIQNDANIFLVGFLEQKLKCRIATEQRVYGVIIISVVTVIRSGGKDRVEIKSRDSQILEIVESLCNSVQVAAFETMRGGG